MSSLQHNRSRPGVELAADGMSVPRGSHRLLRVLCVLMVAVAIPAAFSTATAAANDSAAPSAALEEQTHDTDVKADGCADFLAKTPVQGATCQTLSDKDRSGERVERLRTSSEDSRAASADKSSPILILIDVYDVWECEDVGGGWWYCELWTYIDIYIFTRQGVQQMPVAPGEGVPSEEAIRESV